MGRHAYCIIAHQDRYNLETLLKLIDDERNVVYLLPDKKSPSGFSGGLSMHRASLTVIPPEKRIDIRWGGLSQVKAELLLFKEALAGPGFSYLHLLSGADLPIKTQDQIHTFFENTKSGTNFIGFSSGEATEKDIHVKTTFHHLFTERQKLPPDASLADKIIFPAAKLMHHGFL